MLSNFQIRVVGGLASLLTRSASAVTKAELNPGKSSATLHRDLRFECNFELIKELYGYTCKKDYFGPTCSDLFYLCREENDLLTEMDRLKCMDQDVFTSGKDTLENGCISKEAIHVCYRMAEIETQKYGIIRGSCKDVFDSVTLAGYVFVQPRAPVLPEPAVVPEKPSPAETNSRAVDGGCENIDEFIAGDVWRYYFLLNLDRDSNCEISLCELKRFATVFGLQTTDRDVEKIILHADKDGSGTIDTKDLIPYYASISREELGSFRFFDLDNDGFLSGDDIHSFFEKYGDVVITTTEVSNQIQVIMTYDIDKDGQLSPEEFAEMGPSLIYPTALALHILVQISTYPLGFAPLFCEIPILQPAAAPNADSCTTSNNCTAGYYFCNKVCKPCPTGTFNDEVGKDYCYKCPVGTYTNKEGQEECSQCPTGTSNFGGADDCGDCPAGRYERDSVCEVCEPGYYQNETRKTSCEPCPPGEFTSGYGSTSLEDCKKCKNGRLSDGTGCKSGDDFRYLRKLKFTT